MAYLSKKYGIHKKSKMNAHSLVSLHEGLDGGSGIHYPLKILPIINLIKRGSCMVWEINMRVCPRLDFDNIMLFNCLGYNFNIYGAFEFLCNSIANL